MSPRNSKCTAVAVLVAVLCVACIVNAAAELTVQIVRPTSDPFSSQVGRWVTFEAVAYQDGVELDDTTVQWQWDFGDDVQSIENPADHVYTASGGYLATVTATVGEASATANIAGSVSVPAGLTVTIVEPSPSHYPTPVNEASTFHATAYMNGVALDDATVAWHWDFGDETDPSTDNPVSHTFLTAGSYVVTVTATVGNLTATATLPGTVAAGGGNAPPGTASVSLTCSDGATACHITTLNATMSGNYANAQVKQLIWKMGDEPWGQWDYITHTGDGGPPVIAWNYDQAGQCFNGSWGTWQGNNVTWKFIVTVQFTIGGMPPTYQIQSDTCQVQVENTVVTNTTTPDVLLHDPTGKDAPATHPISWNIVHKALPGITFSVTVTITNVATGAVARTLTKTQTGVGAGSLDQPWDGTDTMGHNVAGIYAYKIYACDAPGAQCSDQDKSTALALYAPTLSNWNFSEPSMTVSADLTHSANLAGVSFGWDVYDPSLTGPVGCGGHSSATATEHTDATSFSLNPSDPFGAWTYVVSEWEGATQAAANRSGQAKPAAQRGVQYVQWPNAINMAGLNGGGPDQFFTDRVTDAMNKQAIGDVSSHYEPQQVSPTAEQAKLGLPHGAVFFYCGHGYPNVIGPTDVPPESLNGDFGRATPQPENDVSHKYWIFNLAGQALRRCLFACYGGCDTAVTDAYGANLLDATIAKGATSAMGFNVQPDQAGGAVFWGSFWQWAMSDGVGVSAAAWRAKYDTFDRFQQYYGYDSYVIRNNVCLMPPRFGG